MLPGTIPAMATQVGPYIAYLNANTSTSNLASFSFTSVNLGSPSPDRYIIVGASFYTSSSRGITGITVGGVSATRIIRAVDSNSRTQNAEIWLAAVPTGTTGTIVVTLNSIVSGCAAYVWQTSGLSSATPADTLAATGATGGVIGGTIDVPLNGFCIGFSMFTGVTSGLPGGHVGWTGITYDADNILETNFVPSGAHKQFYTAQTGLSVSANFGSGILEEADFVAASWV